MTYFGREKPNGLLIAKNIRDDQFPGDGAIVILRRLISWNGKPGILCIGLITVAGPRILSVQAPGKNNSRNQRGRKKSGNQVFSLRSNDADDQEIERLKTSQGLAISMQLLGCRSLGRFRRLFYVFEVVIGMAERGVHPVLSIQFGFGELDGEFVDVRALRLPGGYKRSI